MSLNIEDKVQVLNQIINASERNNSLRDETLTVLLDFLFKNKLGYAWTENCWYEFNKHIWRKISNIQAYVSSRITTHYETICKNINFDDDNFEVINVGSVVANLNSDSFMKSIIKQLKVLSKTHCAKFEDKLNTNKFLLGFENGVYDLKNNQFRDGQPEDYISCSVNYNYETNTSNIQEVYRIMEGIFGNNLIKCLNILATCLSGIPVNKIFFLKNVLPNNITNGCLNNLLKRIFGDYYINLSSSLITQKSLKKTSVILGLCKNKRCVVFLNIHKDTKFYSASIKSLCGSDLHLAKYSKGYVQFVPQFKMLSLLNVNDLPNFENYHSSLKRRIECVDFSNNVDNLDTVDNSTFMHLLIEHWKFCQKNGFGFV